jgi:cation diffusion facilitator CzcD-associated flavoprotein CzcO
MQAANEDFVMAHADTKLDAVIVGAGFAGMYMLHRLRTLGFSARVYERGSGVGGTWYWNRYPGARCDVESMQYSYQFDDALQQEWTWTERYAAQPELLAYANHVADSFDLKRDIVFSTAIAAARYDEQARHWTVKTDGGCTIIASTVIMATGCLSSTNEPSFPGRETYRGNVYHTGRWPKEGVDFSGLNVGVIGTGSSAVQSVPLIARQARHLTVFQRTANYVTPAYNGPIDPVRQAAIKANYATVRARAKTTRNGIDYPIPTKAALELTAEERARHYEARYALGGLAFNGVFTDQLIDPHANELAGDFLRAKIRTAVKDPATAELLSPRTVVGCKRLCVDSGYYETFNRDNVSLVDISKSGIETLTAKGLVAGGKTYDFDALVFATGFDAMTGTLLRMNITGRGGETLREAWAGGPKTYLGLLVAGFPNLFLITGPGSPSVLTNMLPSIEQHVEWIGQCLADARNKGATAIEAEPAAQEAWVGRVNEIAAGTLFPNCNSWYLGANVPGKPRVFMPYIGFPAYVEQCAAIAASGYPGLSRT